MAIGAALKQVYAEDGEEYSVGIFSEPLTVQSAVTLYMSAKC